MGNQCLPSNSIQIYARQLEETNLQELKSQWSTIRSYKIKRIFEKQAQKPQPNSEMQLNFDSFCELFPEFIRYEKTQKKRIFEVFDRSRNGYVNWRDFYDSITLCYFGDDITMATIMFIIFDEFLDKRLDAEQVALLVDLNANYLFDGSIMGSQMELQSEQVVEKLLSGQSSINLERWLSKSAQFFDFKQFRRLFNIFKEEKLQKQLVQNFTEWNELYDEEQGKYVSYIISFKWFEAWRIYVENNYSIVFNMSEKNPATLKSIKTKKSLKTSNSNKSKRHITVNNETIRLRLQNAMANSQSNMPNDSSFLARSKGTHVEEVRNYDMIRSSIGQRPKTMYNHFLEGQYARTIKSGLVENRDYVLVSQKVWNYLTEIYSGQPEFRRTGFDQIELSPKIIRIFSGMFKGQIDNSSEIIREVPNNRTVEDLMTKSLEIEADNLKNLSIYYRAFGMATWVEIVHLNQALIQLTQCTIILLVYVQKNSAEDKELRERYLNVPKNIKESNLGDTLIYEDTVNKIEKEIVFFSKTPQGKYIIHFVGESYANDLCLSEKQFTKCCKISRIPEQSTPTVKNGHRVSKKRQGIQNVKNLSFITSFIVQFLESSKVRELLNCLTSNDELGNSQTNKNRAYLLVILAYFNQQIRANIRIDPKDVIYMVDAFFPSYKNFDITQINSFIISFCEKLKEEAQVLKFGDIIRNQYEFSVCTSTNCPRCHCESQECEVNQSVLAIDIPEPLENYYQVIFVPFCLTMSSQSIRKFSFQLPKKSTLKTYRTAFEKVADIEGKNYILLEIEGNTIIKNYNHVKDDQVTLENIFLREDDNIYAFELCLNFATFVTNHFSFSEAQNYEIEQKDLKVGDMIDCRTTDKGWVYGKIVDKDIMPYTYQQNLKVMHKMNGTQSIIQSYKIAKSVVAFFPSQSFKNCDQYHIRLVQRVFNEANNEMINCNLPLVVALAGWMRPKEFQYLVYLQVQRFIISSLSFQGETVQTNFTGSSIIGQNIIRETTKMKVKKFKQYLYGKNLPYQLNFIDSNGHCLICYKFVKSHIFKGESQEYCEGCNLSNDEPISWQILVNDLMVAIDWKNTWSYRTDIAKNDSSYVTLQAKRKKDIQTIESCLQKTMNKSETSCEMLCCNIPIAAKISKTLPILPNTLILSLNRIVEENGFKKEVKRPVFFGDENITIQDQEYKLVGVIGSKGHQNSMTYTSYIKETRENERTRWLAYNGERVEIIRKEEIDKRCTHVFIYQKIHTIKRAERVQTQMPKKTIMPQFIFQPEIDEETEIVQDQPEVKKQENKNEQKCQDNEEVVSQDEENRSSNNLVIQNYGLKINLLRVPQDDFEIEQ